MHVLTPLIFNQVMDMLLSFTLKNSVLIRQYHDGIGAKSSLVQALKGYCDHPPSPKMRLCNSIGVMTQENQGD